MKFKKASAILGISIMGLGLIGCGSAAETKTNKSNWEVVKTIDNVKQNANHIGGFLTEDYGFTVGYAGECHYTTDGGETWPKASNKSICRFGVYFIDENLGWNCGNGGNVRKTTDGGKTWTELTDFGDYLPNQCRYIKFTDENTGWIASPKKLGATKDGGKTWTTLTLPSGIGDIMTIDLLDANTGYLVDINNNLYITKDAGTSWNSKPMNISDINNEIVPTNEALLRFTDNDNGTFFYYDTNQKLKCSTTKDGGDTWEEQTMPDTEGFGIFLSADEQYLSINSVGKDTITLLKQN